MLFSQMQCSQMQCSQEKAYISITHAYNTDYCFRRPRQDLYMVHSQHVADAVFASSPAGSVHGLKESRAIRRFLL